MIFLLFPTMRSKASSLENTSFFIFTNKGTSLPILTEFLLIIVENLRFSSKILKVMSIVTLSFVVFLVKWTPFSLEIKHVEVLVLGHIMNDSSLDILLWVCEWTKISVLTLMKFFGVSCAKLGLIFLFVVESFHSIVRKWAFVWLRTLICLLVVAYLWIVGVLSSTLVFYRVKILAIFMIMLLAYGTRFDLE